MKRIEKTIRSYALFRMALAATVLTAAGGCATQTPLAPEAGRAPASKAGDSKTLTTPIRELQSKQLTDISLKLLDQELSKLPPSVAVINGLLDGIARQHTFTPEQVQQFSAIMNAAPKRLNTKRVLHATNIENFDTWWFVELEPSFKQVNDVMHGTEKSEGATTKSLKDFFLRLDTLEPKRNNYPWGLWEGGERKYQIDLFAFDDENRKLARKLSEKIPFMGDSEITEVVDSFLNSPAESVVTSKKYEYFLSFSETNPKLRKALTEKLFTETNLAPVEKFKIASKYGLLDWLVQDSIKGKYTKDILIAIVDGTIPSDRKFSNIEFLIREINAGNHGKYLPVLATSAKEVYTADVFMYLATFFVEKKYYPEVFAAEAANRILRTDFSAVPSYKLRRLSGDTFRVQTELFPILNTYFERNGKLPGIVYTSAFNPDYYSPLVITPEKGTWGDLIVELDKAEKESLMSKGKFNTDRFAFDVRNPKRMQWIEMKVKDEVRKSPSFIEQCKLLFGSIF